MSATDTQSIVRERYSDAAQQREPELCCPVDYNAQFLKVIPQEVIDRDYGCGDPSKHIREGETVLDLGSGGGKICFIASQVVGREGQVIGVDMNDEMLSLARKHQPTVADAIGHDNVEFRKGKIQDLAIDREAIDAFLREHPVTDDTSLQTLEAHLETQRREQPMIPDGSIDVVVSNCVLNLVDNDDKELLFDELFRVIRPGGRAVISDIVADQPVPESMRNDPELWSGCISGAFEQSAFLEAFENAGFEDIEILDFQSSPWRMVADISFRSMTVIAYRPMSEAGTDELADEQDEQPVPPDSGVERIYRGPFKFVSDDAGIVYSRGEVCEGESAVAASRSSIADHFAVIHQGQDLDTASKFPACDVSNSPSSRSTSLPTHDGDCCGGSSCC
ncbi:MAG: methyltransferase domain-containing protein [Planctomycetota bacterium]